MPNNLATLSAALAVQLRDTDYKVWTSNELDNLITWAVALLYPRVVRPFSQTIAHVVDQESYALNVAMRKVFRVDILDSDDLMIGTLPGGTWELRGDRNDLGTALTIFVNRSFSTTGYSFYVTGYGTYDMTANYLPDRIVPLVMARARAEAYRRMGSSRVQFEQWASENQRSNVSVNELLQMIREAEMDAERLESVLRFTKKPMPGRV